MGFLCCRSNKAVDERAHDATIIAERQGRQGEQFDEDLKAVQWLRDRSLERSLERNLSLERSRREGEEEEEEEEEEELKVVREFPQIQSQPSPETPIVTNTESVAILEELLREQQQEDQTAEGIEPPEEELRILSLQEAAAFEREEQHEKKLNKRRRRERRRKPDNGSFGDSMDSEDPAQHTVYPKESHPIKANPRDRNTKSHVPSNKKVPTHSKPQRVNPPPPMEDEPPVNDDVSVARYKVAVQLLHRRLVQKQQTLTPAEKEFLQDLLKPDDEESDLESKISLLESTVERFDAKDQQSAPKSLLKRESPVPPADAISIFSATSSNSGAGVETSLPGARWLHQEKHISNRKAWTQTQQQQELMSPVLIKKLDEQEEEDEISDSPFPIFGVGSKTRGFLLTVRLMEALRGFLPYTVSEENFWLKFRLAKDGSSLSQLLNAVASSHYTLLIIQAKDGDASHVFGSFTSTPWRRQSSWFGTGQAFLFKKTDTLEVYPFTGSDDMVQYCSTQMLAVGGGDWGLANSPFGKRETNGIGLLVDGDLLGGESYSCATFCNPKLSKTNEFTISNLEVWTLTPCMSQDQAEKLESHKLFVETHRQTTLHN
jgi:hypothetical protein